MNKPLLVGYIELMVGGGKVMDSMLPGTSCCIGFLTCEEDQRRLMVIYSEGARKESGKVQVLFLL